METNRVVPLELTRLLTLELYGQLQKSGVEDKNLLKKGGKNLGQFHHPDRT